MSRSFITLQQGWILARRNIAVQIRQHALGYAWTVLTPVIYAVFYILVRNALSGRSLDMAGDEAYWDIIRAFSGVALTQAFIQLLQDTTGVVRTNRAFFRGLDVSPTPFVLAGAIEGGFNIFVRLTLIVTAVPLLGLNLPQSPSSWVAIAGSGLSVLLAATALGLLLAPWAALYPDVRKAISTLSLPLILISPIFYPAVENTNTALYWINAINPLAPTLALLHSALRSADIGNSVYLVPLALQLCLFVILLFLCARTLPRAVQILLERLG